MTPLASYPVRTPRWVWFINLAVAAIAIGGAIWIAGKPALWRVDPGYGVMFIAVMLAVVVVAFGASRPYFVSSRAIDIYPDRIEVPRPWSGRDSFPLAALTIERVRIVQKVSAMLIPIGTVDRGVRVTLRAGRTRRTLADRVFRDPDALVWLLDDASAVSRGEAPRGFAAWKDSAPVKPSDEIVEDDDDTYEQWQKLKRQG